jgi:predicted CXXCH cytochrome family protein
VVTLRVLALAALLFGALPAGTGRTGTLPTSSELAGSAAGARVGTSGGRVSGSGVTIRLPRGALTAAALVRVTPVTGVPAFAGSRPGKAFAVGATVADSGAALGRFAAPGSLLVSTAGLAGDAEDLRLAVLAADKTWSVLPTSLSSGALSTWIDVPGTYGVVPAGPGTLTVDRNVVARIDRPTAEPDYAPPDAPVVVSGPARQIRLRFLLANTGTTTVTITPRLEYRPYSGGTYVVVPAKPARGKAFHADREWVPVSGPRTGSRASGTGATIPTDSLLIGDPSGAPLPSAGAPEPGTVPSPAPDTGSPPAAPDPSLSTTPQAPAANVALAGATRTTRAVAGHRSMGVNPDQRLTLASGTFTEQEFTVAVSADARHGTGYEFRLTDRGAALAGAVARADIAARTPAGLSPGQREGTPVDTSGKPTRPVPGSRTPTAARGRPDPPATSVTRAATVSLALLGSPTGTVPVRATAALAASTVTPSPAPVTARLALAAAPLTTDPPPQDTTNGVHGPYSLTSSQCGICHHSHDAANSNLLSMGRPQSTLCFSCHNGTGASRNVQAQFNDATLPANDPATRTYYGHDATIETSHTAAKTDEFGGVRNRHSECGDCHNAHRAAPAQSVAQTGGWAASGALNGVSGVQVTNGAAGTAPGYTILNGEDAPVTLEYQLCLKCHSGFTTLPSNDSFTPSRYLLDKGVEFNPANPSFHPVEAAGTNRTAAMAASLAGTSPYKLWNFTADSTIRCVNCHASSAMYDATQPVSAGGDLPAHRSAYPSILLQNYRDRVLKSATEGYDAADFALCYVCHAEEPFVSDASTATNFRLHAMHLTGIAGAGAGGTDIDTAGAGQGNSLCAECHFRIHSTSFPAGTQTLSGSRLVNFAPDVTPYNGELSFSGGTCTLVCHGQAHDHYQY